jgi:flagellar hook-length control protein FliK
MYANIHEKIEKLYGQMENVSVKMAAAEGEAYNKLEAKLERLETRLEELNLWADDMQLIREDYE